MNNLIKHVALVSLIPISFILGQESIKYAYDPATLEENSLTMTQVAFISGCGEAVTLVARNDRKYYPNCILRSARFRKEIEGIVHNKIWKHF